MTATNPAVSAAQYGLAQAVLSGQSTSMPVSVARELIRKTPAALRGKYAKELTGGRNPRRLPIGEMDWTTFDSKQAAKTYARLAEGEGKEAVVQGTVGGKWDVGTWSRKSNPSPRSTYNHAMNLDLSTATPEELRKAESVLFRAIMKVMPSSPLQREIKEKYWKVREALGTSPNPRGKKNPADSAADMYASFHGTPSEEVLEIEETEHYHSHLAELGVLCGVTVETIHGKCIAIGFNGYVYRQGPGKKDTGFVLDKGSPNPWFGFGGDITESPRTRGKHSAWTVSHASREAYKVGFEGKENFHEWLSKNHLDSRSDGLKKILSREYGNGAADEAAGEKLKPGQTARSVKTEAVEPGKATKHLGNKIKVERTADGKFHILGIPGKKFDSFTDAYQFVAQNPSTDRFLMVSKSLSLTPSNESGVVPGPFQRISHGTRVKVIRTASRRVLIEGDYVGVPFYGWVDKDEIGTAKAYKSDHGELPEELLRSNPGRRGPFGEALKAGRDAFGSVDSAIGDVLRNPSDATTADTTLLCSNESGTSLYFEGGDQSLDLASLGFTSDLLRDSMIIGDVIMIYYETQKDFDAFEITQYYHEFGKDEDTKQKVERPVLRYDNMNGKQYLDGGAYVIKKPVFGTSRGIER